jgi:hypothetical protein
VKYGSGLVNSSKLALLAVFSLAGMAMGRAHLGDTEAQCIGRYGAEFEIRDNLGFDAVGDKAASFHVKTPAGSFVMTIVFLNGVASDEKISNSNGASGLSDGQKQAFLDSESAGEAWRKKSATTHTDRSDVTYETEDWIRGDGATARCWMSRKVKAEEQWGEIEFATRDYSAAQKKLDAENGAP